MLTVDSGWDIMHLIVSQNRAGWWWTWLQDRCQRGPSRIAHGYGHNHGHNHTYNHTHNKRGGRASMRAMQAWSCAS